VRKAPSALSALGRRTEPPPISWLMHLTLSRPRLISLAAGFIDNESLPVRETRLLVRELLRSRPGAQAALQYGTTQGDPSLRRLTCAYLRDLDGAAQANAAYAADRMIITNGSQQLLYMLTEALCDPGDIVLVEDPSYFVFLGIVQSRGLRARGIKIDNHGVDLADLERVLTSLKAKGALHRLKFVYLVSYFQNPTGITTSFDRKAGTLRLLRKYEKAAGHPIYLLEDAAYRELGFSTKDVKSSLAVRAGSDCVIYAGTFSKPFATGIRVGFGILPGPVFNSVLGIKGNHDFGTSNFLQHLLARALESGAYRKHLRQLHETYALKAKIMARAIRESFPAEVEWEPARGGLYIWARLPRGMHSGRDSRLFKRALAENVLYVPGELCYADDPARRKPNHEMRLSFGTGSGPEITEGILRLGRTLRALV